MRVMLVLPSKEAWTFSAYEDRVELEEESVYLAGGTDGPRRTVQIVDLRPRPHGLAGAMGFRPAHIRPRRPGAAKTAARTDKSLNCHSLILNLKIEIRMHRPSPPRCPRSAFRFRQDRPHRLRPRSRRPRRRD